MDVGNPVSGLLRSHVRVRASDRDSAITSPVATGIWIATRAVMAVGFALAGVLAVVASTRPADSSWLEVGATAMLAVDLTGCIVWGWSAERRHGLERAAFVCVTMIFTVWTAAAAVWLVSLRHQGEIESLPLMQAGYVAVAVLGLASLALAYRYYRDRPTWEGPVDAGIVALSLAVFLWVLVMPDGTADIAGWLVGVGTAYLAVIGGLAVAIGGMAVWRGSAVHPWLRWALVGVLLLAVDIASSIAAQPSDEHVGLRLAGMAAGVAASTCLVVAALRREGSDDRPAGRERRAHVPRSRVRRVLPAVAVLGAVAAVALGDGVVGWIAIAAVALLVVQVLGTLEFVERLLDERSRWAVTDSLTGAYNRRQLDAELPVLTARAQRAGDPLTAMLLDIDRFKEVNDLHGHAVGDAVLQGVAAAVTRELRAGDVLFRIGGDEFMVLAPSTASVQALALADRIRAAVADDLLAILPRGPRVTASIGVVDVRPDRPSTPGVIERADAALYAAKDLGGDRVVLGGSHGAAASR